jgi:hypothetical protein
VLSINAAISAAVVLASRLHEDLAVFALMLFSVEAFALFPVLRRRLQVRSIPFDETGAHEKQAVCAGSSSGACHWDAWVGRTSSAITWAMCGRAGERYIWGTSCPDVGTTVQAVCFSSSIFLDLGISDKIFYKRDPRPLGRCNTAWIRGR